VIHHMMHLEPHYSSLINFHQGFINGLWCHVWNQNSFFKNNQRLINMHSIRYFITVTMLSSFMHCSTTGFVITHNVWGSILITCILFHLWFLHSEVCFIWHFILKNDNYFPYCSSCAPSILRAPLVALLFLKMAPTKFTGKPCILTLKAVFSFQYDRCCSQEW